MEIHEFLPFCLMVQANISMLLHTMLPTKKVRGQYDHWSSHWIWACRIRL